MPSTTSRATITGSAPESALDSASIGGIGPSSNAFGLTPLLRHAPLRAAAAATIAKRVKTMLHLSFNPSPLGGPLPATECYVQTRDHELRTILRQNAPNPHRNFGVDLRRLAR